MGYYKKWKPSRTKVKEFIIKMNEIDEFCNQNGISQSSSSDSYYFTLNEISYRVSNHSVEKSHYLDAFGNSINYHGNSDNYRQNTFCIHASKTRLIEIYNRIKEGKQVDHNGYEVSK